LNQAAATDDGVDESSRECGGENEGKRGKTSV
jgi:hypothetical protein